MRLYFLVLTMTGSDLETMRYILMTFALAVYLPTLSNAKTAPYLCLRTKTPDSPEIWSCSDFRINVVAGGSRVALSWIQSRYSADGHYWRHIAYDRIYSPFDSFWNQVLEKIEASTVPFYLLVSNPSLFSPLGPQNLQVFTASSSMFEISETRPPDHYAEIKAAGAAICVNTAYCGVSKCGPIDSVAYNAEERRVDIRLKEDMRLDCESNWGIDNDRLETLKTLQIRNVDRELYAILAKVVEARFNLPLWATRLKNLGSKQMSYANKDLWFQHPTRAMNIQLRLPYELFPESTGLENIKMTSFQIEKSSAMGWVLHGDANYSLSYNTIPALNHKCKESGQHYGFVVNTSNIGEILNENSILNFSVDGINERVLCLSTPTLISAQ